MSLARRTDFADAMKEALHDTVYTPDINALERCAYHPVFVYGTTQLNYSDHHAMNRYPRFGEGYTFGSHYTMYMTKDHEPAVFSEPKHPACGEIYGEIYVVPVDVIRRIDAITCNGRHFVRRKELVIYRREEHLSAPAYSSDAWMWLANEKDDIFVRNKNTQNCVLKAALYSPRGRFFRFTPQDDIPNRLDNLV